MNEATPSAAESPRDELTPLQAHPVGGVDGSSARWTSASSAPALGSRTPRRPTRGSRPAHARSVSSTKREDPPRSAPRGCPAPPSRRASERAQVRAFVHVGTIRRGVHHDDVRRRRAPHRAIIARELVPRHRKPWSHAPAARGLRQGRRVDGGHPGYRATEESADDPPGRRCGRRASAFERTMPRARRSAGSRSPRRPRARRLTLSAEESEARAPGGGDHAGARRPRGPGTTPYAAHHHEAGRPLRDARDARLASSRADPP